MSTDNLEGGVSRIIRYFPLLTAYAVVVGTLYLWGFWSKFHFNVLEYVSLLELARNAAFPLISAIVGIVGGMILGRLLTFEKFPEGGGRNSPVGIFLDRHWKAMLAIYLAVVLIFPRFILDDDMIALVQPLALWLPVFPWVLRSNVLADVIETAAARASVLMILSFILVVSFGFGRGDAAQIVSGREYFAVDVSSIENFPKKYTSQSGEFKLLGHLGSHVFILAPDDSIVALEGQHSQALVLTYRSKMKKMWSR